MTKIVAEIAQAHDGSWGMLESLIDKSIQCKVDAIKLQLHYAEYESTHEEQFRINMSKQYKSRFDYWKHVEIPDNLLKHLSEKIHKSGKELIISPFSEYAIKKAVEFSADRLKIASGEIHNPKLGDECRKTGLPLILSTGLASKKIINQFINDYFRKDTISRKKHTILHCISKYPTSPKFASLLSINNFKKEYPQYDIGLSDHSGTIHPALFAISTGSTMVELHVTFSKDMYGPDSTSSITFEELNIIIEHRNYLSKALKFNKSINNRTKSLFTRSLCLKESKPKGYVIKYEDLVLKKPGGGYSLDDINFLIDKTLAKDVSSNNLIKTDDLI